MQINHNFAGTVPGVGSVALLFFCVLITTSSLLSVNYHYTVSAVSFSQISRPSTSLL